MLSPAEVAITNPPTSQDQIPPPQDDGDRYKDAGVDIDAGEAFVEMLKPLARSTVRPGAEAELGGFGGFFDLKAAGYQDPVLCAASDGVGTKLKVAVSANDHSSIGVDLVAMCVNDLVVQGAEPLLFLDYFATGKLDPAQGKAIVSGIAEGCRQAGAALVGGETAEMPGVYATGDYDLAGFAVGAVERGGALNGSRCAAGDRLIGLTSSGAHANGFSLIRRIVAEHDLDWGAPAPFDPVVSLAAAFLTPTRIYVKSCLAAVRDGYVNALAHITGGGLVNNIPRALPKHLAAAIDVSAVPQLPMFRWLCAQGGVSPTEMARVFNCGIGMVAAVPQESVDRALAVFAAHGERAHVIGKVVARQRNQQAVRLDGLVKAWAL